MTVVAKQRQKSMKEATHVIAIQGTDTANNLTFYQIDI